MEFSVTLSDADKAVGGSFVTTDSDERWNKINQTKNFWANLEWINRKDYTKRL